jgi:hypothetical protein
MREEGATRGSFNKGAMREVEATRGVMRGSFNRTEEFREGNKEWAHGEEDSLGEMGEVGDSKEGEGAWRAITVGKWDIGSSSVQGQSYASTVGGRGITPGSVE